MWITKQSQDFSVAFKRNFTFSVAYGTCALLLHLLLCVVDFYLSKYFATSYITGVGFMIITGEIVASMNIRYELYAECMKKFSIILFLKKYRQYGKLTRLLRYHAAIIFFNSICIFNYFKWISDVKLHTRRHL